MVSQDILFERTLTMDNTQCFLKANTSSSCPGEINCSVEDTPERAYGMENDDTHCYECKLYGSELLAPYSRLLQHANVALCPCPS